MIYLWSDLHFQHDKPFIYGTRGYDTIGGMNQGLVNKWNDRVSPTDTVYVLGDIVMGHRMESLNFVRLLQGDKILVPGNHDHCHPSNKKAAYWTEQYQAAGLYVAETRLDWEINGRHIALCHFPTSADDYDDRDFSMWQPKADYDVLLHGHVHGFWKINGNQINVGVDVWPDGPVALDHLLTLV